MSNQGNIEVRANHKVLLWTTERWCGNSTPLFVQKILGSMQAQTPAWAAKTFLSFLADRGNPLFEDCDIGGQPILELGNTDTPTVVVSSDSGRVYWRSESEPVNVVADWSIEDYIKLELADYKKMTPEIKTLMDRWY